MGVSYEHVVLYGYRVPYDEYDFDECEPYYYGDQEVGDVVVIADGRGGDYLFIGVLQAKSADGRYERASLPITRITEPTATQCLQLGRAIEELGFTTEGDPDHFVFTHFS